MATTHSNNEFDDELLSAYVDDELTSAERQAVEARLRTDARARQLVDELREVSSAIRAMPRQATPRNLRAQVLAEVDAVDDVQDGPISIPINRWEGYRRGMAWSALMIAAALMLMFMQSQREEAGDQGELADAKANRVAIADNESHAEKRVNRGLAAAPEMRAAAAPEPPPASPEAASESLEPFKGAIAKSAPPMAGAAADSSANGLGLMAAATESAPREASASTPVVELKDIEGRGMGRLKELLAQNKIELTGGDRSGGNRAASAAAGESKREDNSIQQESEQKAGQAPTPADAIQATVEAERTEGEAILVEGSAMQMAGFLAACQAEAHSFVEITAGSRAEQFIGNAPGEVANGEGSQADAMASASGRPRGPMGGDGLGGRPSPAIRDKSLPQSAPAPSNDSRHSRAGRARQLSADQYREVVSALPAVRAGSNLAYSFDAHATQEGRDARTAPAAVAGAAVPPLQADPSRRDDSLPADNLDRTDQVRVLVLLRRSP